MEDGPRRVCVVEGVEVFELRLPEWFVEFGVLTCCGVAEVAREGWASYVGDVCCEEVDSARRHLGRLGVFLGEACRRLPGDVEGAAGFLAGLARGVGADTVYVVTFKDGFHIIFLHK